MISDIKSDLLHEEADQSKNMPPRSRRDREARSQLEEEHFTPSELTNVELDADGKPCRACTAAKSTLSSLSLESIAGNKRLDCAPDVNQIGNSSWTLLHTIAAYYPAKPTEEKKKAVFSFYDSFSKLYPCHYCADELRNDLKNNKIEAASREELMKWTCEMHNRVNIRLGKDTFDCNIKFLDQRWKDGWKDGSCG